MERVIYKKKHEVEYDTEIDCIVHTELETIDKLIQGYSIARFGDGEILMMIGENMAYEKYDSSLKEHLQNILTKKESHPKLLIGIPPSFIKTDPNIGKGQNFYWNYSIRYLKMNKYLPLLTQKEYYSSFFTQLYAYNDEYCVQIVKKLACLWNNRKVVLFLNEKVKAECLVTIMDMFKKATELNFEIVPSSFAWSIKSKLLEQIKKYDKSSLILICCGATATVLAYEATVEGYQVIDFGQIIENINYSKNIYVDCF